MSRATQQTLLLQTDYVNLSFCGFAFWWLVIFCVYAVTTASNAAYAKFYWDFNTTLLSYTMESYRVGMPREQFNTIAYVHIVMAAIHGLSAVMMVVASLRQRTLVFSLSSTQISSNDMETAKDSRQNKTYVASSTHSSSRVWHVATEMYRTIADRHGVLGVSGRHFHTILVCREILETGLQTIQAVRMSKFLPRILLNRFYVCLLAVNCWSSVLIYSRWFWKDEARLRFAAIVCACALDLMSTMGVSIIVVLSYVNQYDVVLQGFGFDLLGDDEWIAQMLNEAQVVVVVSWSDLATRFIFSLGLIITTTNMKELLYYAPANGNRVVHCNDRTLIGAGEKKNVTISVTHTKSKADALLAQTTKQPSHHSRPGSNVRNGRVLLHGVHFLLALWGVVVLILHIHASMQEPLMECMPRVHPIAGALPSCFMVNFNCHQLQISGERGSVQAEWNKFELNTAVKLQILHCVALEVPESFQKFHQLAEIRVYNSTIVDWGVEASITNTHHPDMTMISVVRVNMTEGQLPLGFQALDFPLNLNQIYFCETNLQSLPSDLDTKWHIGSNIYLENSKLTVVPPVLVRIQPYYLTLAGNPMIEFSPELFEIGYLQYIIIGRTKALELPQHVPHPTTGPTMIDITKTNISFFWSWIDPLIENMREITPPIIGGGSTYCAERDNIMNGVAGAFSQPFQEGHSLLLMNASESNWDVLRKAVDCSPVIWVTQFPLDFWDQMYAITD